MPLVRTRVALLSTGVRCRLAALGVGCVWALSAARVSSGESIAPAMHLPPVVVGVSNVQSGPSSDLGHELVLGSQSYFDLVNKDGGIHGRRISILLKDDKYEPDPAVKNTNDLIELDKVFFLFDNSSSTYALRIAKKHARWCATSTRRGTENLESLPRRMLTARPVSSA
jgi:hypothetical protein